MEPDHEHEGEFQNEIIEQLYEKRTLKEYIDDQIKRSPWWLISLIVHGLMILILIQIPFMADTKKTEEIVVQTDMIEEIQEEEKEELKEVFEEKEVEVTETEIEEVTEEVVVEEVEVETEVEVDTMEEVTEVTEFSLEQADTPDVGAGALGEIGLGNAGGGAGGPLGGRASAGSRKRAVGRYGGTRTVLTAVDRALLYLARVQDADGGWYPGKHEGKAESKYDVAMSGAALLCFLGAGHSEVAGKHRDTVKRAVSWLIEQQDDSGHFDRNMYAHGIASLAITEAFAMGMKSRTKQSAQKAINYIFEAQNTTGGWGYSSKTPRSDISVMGWQMMAIKSAKIGKLGVSEAKIKRALKEFKRATEPEHNRVGYAIHPEKKIFVSHGNPRMTMVGMCIKQFFGMKKNHPELSKPADYLLRQNEIPQVNPKRINGKGDKKNSYYSMYYGALVMFQMGGQYWKQWKDPMLAFLEPTQDKSGGPLDGSWDPHHADGVHGGEDIGRIGSTAFYCLSLEVFWRYMPLYK